jgi:hypothetical protein
VPIPGAPTQPEIASEPDRGVRASLNYASVVPVFIWEAEMNGRALEARCTKTGDKSIIAPAHDDTQCNSYMWDDDVVEPEYKSCPPGSNCNGVMCEKHVQCCDHWRPPPGTQCPALPCPVGQYADGWYWKCENPNECEAPCCDQCSSGYALTKHSFPVCNAAQRDNCARG